jgi:NitT/TauT family transport system substrate-binding protein
MKKFIVYSFVLLLILSCARRQRADSLVLGVMPSMDYLPLAVAVEKGYAAELGLELTIRKFYSAGERDAAFQSGVIDGTVIDYTGAILQSAGGIDLKLISACDAPFYIVAGKNSGITALSELKGKKIAVSQNTVIDYCVDRALAYAGLSPSDAEKAEVGRIPLRFELLQNGKIDATGLPEPFASKAENAGGIILTSNAELGFAITGIMFTGKAVKEKRKLIQLMYKAYDMGAEYIRTHGAEDIRDVLIKEMGFAEDDLKDVLIPVVSDAKRPSPKDLADVYEWLVSRGAVDGGFDPGVLLDAELLGD